MLIEYILAFSLAMVIRLVFLVGARSTDDFVHLWCIKSRRHYKSLLNFIPEDSVIQGTKAKPQLFHYIISILPYKYWIAGARILNILLDCIIILLTMIFSSIFFEKISDVHSFQIFSPSTYTALILATSPILLPVTARLKSIGARVFGYTLFCIYMVFIALIVFGYPIIGFIGSFVAIILIVLSSQFAMQLTIWASFVISIAYLNVLPFLATILVFLYIWFVDRCGIKEIVLQKINHGHWYFRNAQKGTTATGRNKLSDHIRLPVFLIKEPTKALLIIFNKSVPIIVLHSVLPFILLLYFFVSDPSLLTAIYADFTTKFLFWVLISAASACFLTSLPSLLFLGQAERYFEYAMPAISILYSFAVIINGRSEKWLIYIILFQVIMVLINYIFANKLTLYNSMLGYVESSFQELIDFLKNLKPSRILTVPTKFSFRLSTYLNGIHLFYFRGVSRPDEGFMYMERDNVTFDMPIPDWNYFRKLYGIDTVVLNKPALNKATKQNIDYNVSQNNILFENDEYIVISIS